MYTNSFVDHHQHTASRVYHVVGYHLTNIKKLILKRPNYLPNTVACKEKVPGIGPLVYNSLFW